jgi:uncharacterized protein YsxB (DUF464 family)
MDSRLSQWRTGNCQFHFLARYFSIQSYPVNMVCFAVKTVIAQLISYIQQHEQTTGNTDTEAQYIQNRVKPLLEQVAKGNGKIIFDHVL